MMGTRVNESGRFPFTASQWQELEHQALVYKYMISGMPIPPDLLFTIKRSLDSPTKLLLHHQPPHPSIGWNCFQMGFGRKIDPEPGRCRRTDGKKWRCAKEAYPDSKYCERHMHRGRNRSRKPVEVNNNNMSTKSTSPIIPVPPSICAKSPNYPSPNSHPLSSDYHSGHLSSISRGGFGHVLSSQDHFLLESNSPYPHLDKDYRIRYGMMKEGVDEHPFFSESSGSVKAGFTGSSMGDSWHLEPLAMSHCSSHDYGYSYLQPENARKQQKQEKEELNQKVMHHFFDEWPPKDDSSNTQLSISIPTSAHDFFRTQNDE